jgi:hypothetical protein
MVGLNLEVVPHAGGHLRPCTSGVRIHPALSPQADLPHPLIQIALGARSEVQPLDWSPSNSGLEHEAAG